MTALIPFLLVFSFCFCIERLTNFHPSPIGLVLYWFGHAPKDRLGNGHGDVIVKGWSVPKEFLMPTGDIARVGSWVNN